MKAILVQNIEGHFITTFLERKNLIDAMEARGYTFTGLTRATGPLRAELREQPKFAGLNGPMWGGQDTPLRYEDAAAYKTLSA